MIYLCSIPQVIDTICDFLSDDEESLTSLQTISPTSIRQIRDYVSLATFVNNHYKVISTVNQKTSLWLQLKTYKVFLVGENHLSSLHTSLFTYFINHIWMVRKNGLWLAEGLSWKEAPSLFKDVSSTISETCQDWDIPEITVPLAEKICTIYAKLIGSLAIFLRERDKYTSKKDIDILKGELVTIEDIDAQFETEVNQIEAEVHENALSREMALVSHIVDAIDSKYTPIVLAGSTHVKKTSYTFKSLEKKGIPTLSLTPKLASLPSHETNNTSFPETSREIIKKFSLVKFNNLTEACRYMILANAIFKSEIANIKLELYQYHLISYPSHD